MNESEMFDLAMNLIENGMGVDEASQYASQAASVLNSLLMADAA